MPLTQLNFLPGLDTENTETGAEGRWTDCDKIRFRKGLPQKIGGWAKYSTDFYIGRPASLTSWISLDGTRYQSFAGDRKAYVYRSGTTADVTPIRQSNTLSNVFSTVNLSSNVVITHTSHGAALGSFITISNVSANVGGITTSELENEFEIVEVNNNDAYTISTPGTANATVNDSSNADISYQLNVGPTIQTFGYGWSAGAWNDSVWGEPRTTSEVNLDMRQWSLNNWGEDLILTVRDGSTFEWDESVGMSNNRCTLIANAPTASSLSVVSTDTRHLICMGTETTIGDFTTQDKMFIRWSDQENYDFWSPNATNSAGSQRIAGGSEIRTAKPAKGTILVWTDTTLHSMSFIGPPFIFGFRQLGNDCGAVGLNSAIVVDDIAYWMSDGQFFRFAGAVQEIPCPVLNHVFDNINKTQYAQVYAGQTSEFSEVIWYYCSATSDFIDKYVIYNYLENSWYFGNLSRSTYLDDGVELNPLATEYFPNSTANSYTTIYGLTPGRSLIYRHEDGVDADGSAITSFIESGDGDIADGEEFSFINKVIPDFKNQVGNAKITLQTRDYPNSSRVSGEEITVSNTTPFYNTRTRGRQSSIKIESDELGSNWRFGTLRIQIRPDGKR
jgi:hypothetical protein|tara:strand:- start:163 stop:2007 length:1845 start_codon:yes stop_codon:yes gene_type:complete